MLTAELGECLNVEALAISCDPSTKQTFSASKFETYSIFHGVQYVPLWVIIDCLQAALNALYACLEYVRDWVSRAALKLFGLCVRCVHEFLSCPTHQLKSLSSPKP